MSGYTNYSLVTYWGINVTCNPGGIHTTGNTFICNDTDGKFVPNQEITLPEQGDKLLKAGAKYVFPYMYWGCTQATYAEAQLFNQHDEWIAKNGSGQPVECEKFQGIEQVGINYTSEGAQDFYINEMVMPFLNASSTSGMFFDEFGLTSFRYLHGDTDQQVQQMANASLATLSKLLSAFKAAGKVAIVSLKSSYPTDFIDRYFDILEEYKPHGMYYGEFFCVRDCLLDYNVFQKAVLKGIPVQQHIPMASTAEFNFRLATYLLGVGEQCYAGVGIPGDWSPTGFPWIPEYDKPLGQPLGPSKQTGPHTFTREFEYVSVSVNFNTSEGVINWS
eukprot:TRINITY_DN1283_c0_g1_i1.p1 TRINITY_DN1283_c0_g1~~TRINITY_DN1283_c0_g1_i1.p1  ORF type:complete len:379 (+),score=66.94 TRINITY_DN1283_c0_g1_i1:144-1139(+)